MKTFLCYGDSNTWGYNPVTMGRYGYDERWPGVLRDILGKGYQVIEEGLNGRTTVWDDPLDGEYKNGKKYLLPCLESHRPVDLVIIMLGVNDLKSRFSLSAYNIAQGAGILVNIVLNCTAGPDNKAPEALLIAPPIARPANKYSDMFEGAEQKSKEFSKYFMDTAQMYQCGFLDASKFVVSSPVDGIHMDAAEHKKLGLTIGEHILNTYGRH